MARSRDADFVSASNLLPQTFYDRDVVEVARDLLGKLLIRRSRQGLCIGRIVESEAYLAQGDTAAHSHRGKTKKNATMFGPPGMAYVYAIHSRYCVNAVTESRGTASAVLIRAIEPIVGLDVMNQQRGTNKLLDLCRGPARLCEALSIDKQLDGWKLTVGSRLWISEDASYEVGSHNITTSTRIGVTSEKDAQLRFFIDGSPFVSGPKNLHKKKPKPVA